MKAESGMGEILVPYNVTVRTTKLVEIAMIGPETRLKRRHGQNYNTIKPEAQWDRRLIRTGDSIAKITFDAR